MLRESLNVDLMMATLCDAAPALTQLFEMAKLLRSTQETQYRIKQISAIVFFFYIITR